MQGNSFGFLLCINVQMDSCGVICSTSRLLPGSALNSLNRTAASPTGSMWRPENEDEALKPNQHLFYNKVNQENWIISCNSKWQISYNYYYSNCFSGHFGLFCWLIFFEYSLLCCFSLKTLQRLFKRSFRTLIREQAGSRLKTSFSSSHWSERSAYFFTFRSCLLCKNSCFLFSSSQGAPSDFWQCSHHWTTRFAKDNLDHFNHVWFYYNTKSRSECAPT